VNSNVQLPGAPISTNAIARFWLNSTQLVRSQARYRPCDR
jgi:hypothetical protein